MLHVNNLTYRIAGRVLFDNATIAIPDGARVGLVGQNGAGKTTLFHLITGALHADEGSVSVRKGARIGQVAQEAPGDPQTLLDFVLAADTEREALLAEAETAHDAHRIAEIQLRLSDIDAHAAPARAATILNGLGFDTAAQAKPCSDYSGGWRMRVALAAVLFAEPDLLLLDEPTNYLDLEGVMWLEAYLARYPHTIVVISHDRDLLNGAVNTIVHLHKRKLTAYRGGYDQFERKRREQQALDLKLKKKQDAARRHMQAFVDRFRYKASKARQAQSRIKMLEKMEPIVALVDDQVRPFHLPNPGKRMAPPIVQMTEASVGYEPGKPVLRDLTLRIDDDDRIGLLGANGNGKSTLAKLISGRLTTDSGRMKPLHKLQISYFAQHQLDELNPGDSAYDHVRALMPDATIAQVRSRTAQMGFGADKADTPAEKLSGGEKARLQLGIATFNGPHLIILDEPTNHLDADSREALVDALNTYEGAVIIISHDRHLLERTVDRLWLVDGGTVAPYEGDLDDYRRFLLNLRKAGGDRPTATKTVSEPTISAAARRRETAKKRESLAPMRRDIEALEAEIAQLDTDIASYDRTLADPDVFSKDPANGAAIAKSRADAVARREEAEHRWLMLSDTLEQALAEIAG